MSAMKARQTTGAWPRGRLSAMKGFSVAVMSGVTLAMALSMWAARGANAADDAAAAEHAEAALATPIVLAGRWSGPHYGAASRKSRGDCGSGPCTLTYDVVACGADWCGIAVGKDDACGAVAMKLSAGGDPARPNAFKGNLELAKGSDAYVVEAWWRATPEEGGKPYLSLIGDTGPELMMFRRSFPFSAELGRAGDAKCALEKPTS